MNTSNTITFPNTANTNQYDSQSNIMILPLPLRTLQLHTTYYIPLPHHTTIAIAITIYYAYYLKFGNTTTTRNTSNIHLPALFTSPNIVYYYLHYHHYYDKTTTTTSTMKTELLLA